MKKIYENVELELVFFATKDFVRTSQNDNTIEMPEFPEMFG